MIMARFVRLRLAAVPMIAAAIIASTTASGWAFTQQMLTPGNGDGNYNFNYSDPNHPNAGGQSALPSDPNSPGLHFSIEPSQTTPFSGFQSGNRPFGSGGDPTSPGYYIQGK
jgi:hypothetical protein